MQFQKVSKDKFGRHQNSNNLKPFDKTSFPAVLERLPFIFGSLQEKRKLVLANITSNHGTLQISIEGIHCQFQNWKQQILLILHEHSFGWEKKGTEFCISKSESYFINLFLLCMVQLRPVVICKLCCKRDFKTETQTNQRNKLFIQEAKLLWRC